MPRGDELPIVHEDDDVVAIAKPAGLATIPGRGETDCCLQRFARQLRLPCSGTSDPRVRVVHRLDKDTSGVLLFAKNISSQRKLSEQFQNNLAEKEYLALVAGNPSENEGTIDAPIAPHPTNAKRMIVTKHGRAALTLWKVEQRFRDIALLRCFPKTGKTHQIRVHLAHAGMPLLIDPLYNPNSSPLLLSSFKRGYRAKSEEEKPLITRLTLHAERLRVLSLDVTAPLPKDFRSAMQQLEKFCR